MSPAALCAALLLAAAPARAAFSGPLGESAYGVLLLGEGGDRSWRQTLDALRKAAGPRVPVEFAGGLADARVIQKALDALQARRVKTIVAVPLFVSSFSEVMDQNRYLLGIREAPSKEFMGAPHSRQSSATSKRAASKVPVVLAKALDDHPLFVELLAERAKALSRKPAEEVLLLVGEAPAAEESAAEFKSLAGGLAEKVRQKAGLRAAQAALLVTGGGQSQRERSAQDLRSQVKDLRREGTVLVVPLALASGALTTRLPKALDGLFVKWNPRPILPDPRVDRWALASAEEASRLPDMRVYKEGLLPKTGLTPLVTFEKKGATR